MKSIGFNFNKISIEKFSDKFENLKINTKIDILKIKEVDSDFLKSEEKLIVVEFNYFIDYDPKIAKIEISGRILLTDKVKIIKNILKEWKNKKISEDFKINLFNIILRKSNLKAMQLEDEVNLPLHMPLPLLKKQ
jgi:hypothetical protein